MLDNMRRKGHWESFDSALANSLLHIEDSIGQIQESKLLGESLINSSGRGVLLYVPTMPL